MREAKERDYFGRFRAHCYVADVNSADTFQSRNCNQNKETRDGCQIVGQEIGKEVCAQSENRQRTGDIEKSRVAQGEQKSSQCYVQRRQKEEAVVANAKLQPEQETRE